MSDLNDRKVSLLRKEVVTRYKETPGSADEQVLALLDFNSAKPLLEVYALIGESEHPVHSKSSWISEVAANITLEGYWAWVRLRVDNEKYVMNGTQIMLRGEMLSFRTDTIGAPNIPPMPTVGIDELTRVISTPAARPSPFAFREQLLNTRLTMTHTPGVILTNT